MTFTQCIVIRNPVSTSAHRMQRRIALLQRLLPDTPFTIIDTIPGGREANARRLVAYAALLGPQTLLAVAGGDGTVNAVIATILHDPQLPDRARRAVILPLWGGNGNDLAHMLNGRPGARGLRSALQRGRSVPVRPLLCTVRQGRAKPQVFTAACYASFGASAFAARELERTMPRRSPMRQVAVSRVGQEFVAVCRALLRAPTFTIEEQGRRSIIFERIFLNGSRFAKVFATPLQLTDYVYHRATVERKDLGVLLYKIIGISTGNHRTRVAGTYDRFTIHDPVWAQFDGEAVQLPPHTSVHINIARRPFYALSTRLKGHV